MKKMKTLHINSWNTAHGTIVHTLYILTNLCLQIALLSMSRMCFRDEKKEEVENDHIPRDHFHGCAILHDKALDRWQILWNWSFQTPSSLKIRSTLWASTVEGIPVAVLTPFGSTKVPSFEL